MSRCIPLREVVNDALKAIGGKEMILHVVGSTDGQRGTLRALPGEIVICAVGAALTGHRFSHIFVHESAGLKPQDDWVRTVLMTRLPPGGVLKFLGQDFTYTPIARMSEDDGIATINATSAVAQELGYNLYIGQPAHEYLAVIEEAFLELQALRKEKAGRKGPALKLPNWEDYPHSRR